MMGRAWTTSEKRRLHQMRAQRVPIKQIAAELGRTEHAIYSFLRYIPATRDAPAKMGQTPRWSEVWTKDEIATLVRMVGEGATSREVAAELRRSIKAIRNRASAEGLRFGKPAKVARIEREGNKFVRDAVRGSAMLLDALFKLCPQDTRPSSTPVPQDAEDRIAA